MTEQETHPFTDDPNAEVCTITGGPANARVYDNPREIRGWYGSTVADMTTITVLDDTLPLGPICDEEITKAIESGRAAHVYPLSPAELAALPDVVAKALVAYGIATAERLLTDPGTAGRLPFGYRTDKDEAMAFPFFDGLTGTSHDTDGRTDLVGVGQFLALVSRARGNPLVPGEIRDRAVDQTIADLRDGQRMHGELLEALDRPHRN